MRRRVGLRYPISKGRARVIALIGVGLTAALVAIAVFAISKPHASGSASLGPASGLVAVGAGAPTFTAPSIDVGHPAVTSSSLRGTPVVLNFFASWCHPCKQELPLLGRTAARYHAGVQFVGVDVNDSDASARRLLQASDVTYRVVADPTDVITQRYGLANLPTTFLIGADGRVAHVHTGALTAKILADWLGPPPGAAPS